MKHTRLAILIAGFAFSAAAFAATTPNVASCTNERNGPPGQVRLGNPDQGQRVATALHLQQEKDPKKKGTGQTYGR